MPVFQYEALTPQGQTKKGELEAGSQDDAAKRIQQMGLHPMKIRPKKGGGAAATTEDGQPKRKAGGRVSTAQLTTFSRQLSTLQDAGVALVRSLNILEAQMKPGALKNIVGMVAEDVNGGATLSDAMSRHPKCFDKLYTNMIKAGEMGGVLDVILQKLAEFMEKSQKLKKRIISALVYPACVIFIAVGIVVCIMLFIIPNFIDLFEDMGVTMPLPTQILINTSNAMTSYWYLIPGIPFLFWGIYVGIVSTKGGKLFVDKVKLKVPIFGTIINKSTISRFCRTFGTLLDAGVSILDALAITRDALDNQVFVNALTRVYDAIREGEGIAKPLKATNVTDEMVVNMIDVGEETGELPQMLIRIADTFDDDVDNAVEALTSLIEPMLIVVLGVIVGGIVIALFLPLIEMMKAMSPT